MCLFCCISNTMGIRMEYLPHADFEIQIDLAVTGPGGFNIHGLNICGRMATLHNQGEGPC
jgi:hypothetical protein